MTVALALGSDDEGQGHRPDYDASFEAFLSENYLRLKKFLLRQCFDPHLAEDALHEALIVAMDRWEVVVRHDKPLFWVRQVAWHKLLTLHGQQKWDGIVPLENVVDELAGPGTSYEAERLVLQAASQLPLRHRAVFALMLEGDTDEEIAIQLGLASRTVVTYKTTIRKTYRRLFESGDEGGRDELR